MHYKNMPQGIYAEMHTGKGTIVLFLEHEKAPFTVANFVGLAEGTMPNKAKPAGVPFYDGTIFHRVIPEFMIQGGDPDGMGRGGPGYRFQDEFDSSLTHDGPGILSMANAGPNTNGSQFFITLAAAHARDGINAVFGHVVEGQNVVDAIEAGDRIETIEIVRHGASVADYDSAKTGFVKSDLFLFD